MHQKRPLPAVVFKTVLTSEKKFYGFFSRALFCFHGRNFQKFSRTLISIFTHVISMIFSRRSLGFHGHFSRFFHGDLSTFTDRSLKIFPHRKKFFTGKKKNTAGGARPMDMGMFKTPARQVKVTPAQSLLGFCLC